MSDLPSFDQDIGNVGCAVSLALFLAGVVLMLLGIGDAINMAIGAGILGIGFGATRLWVWWRYRD
jgi:hypothetical protein